MEATKYEVGKFYFIPIMSGFVVKTITAQVVRKLKRKITFKNLYRDNNGNLGFHTVDRNYRVSTYHNAECAYVVYRTGTIIPSAWSDKAAPKPELWDKVEAAEKKGAR